MAGQFDNLTRAQLEAGFSTRRNELNGLAPDSPEALKLLADIQELIVAIHRLAGNGQGAETPCAEQSDEPDGGDPRVESSADDTGAAGDPDARDVKQRQGNPVGGPEPDERDGRQPPRDVHRDPDDPGMSSQIDAFPDPPAAQQSAIDIGDCGYASGHSTLFGEPGTITRSIAGETAIRITAVELDHVGEMREAKTIVATTADRQLKALLDGEAEKRRAERLPDREDELQAAVQDAEQNLEDAKKKFDATEERAEKADVEIKDEVDNATLLQRASLKVGVWMIGIFWLLEILNQSLTLAPSYAAEIELTFVYQDLVTAAIGGAIITFVASVIGILLASLLPQKPAKALLVGGGVLLAVRLYAHVDALREGTDQTGLFLTDLSALGALGTAMVAYALAVNRDFRDRIAERRAAVAELRAVAVADLAEAQRELDVARAAKTSLRDQIEAAAANAAAAPGRALDERIAGTRAEMQVESIGAALDTRISSEKAFGDHREALAEHAWYRARNRKLRDPEQQPTVDVGAPPEQASGVRIGWLLAALAALAIGVIVGLLITSVLAVVFGLLVATVILIIGLLVAGHAGGRTPPPTPVSPPVDRERSITLTRSDLWQHLPTGTRARHSGSASSDNNDI